jgi:hypothetical protein
MNMICMESYSPHVGFRQVSDIDIVDAAMHESVAAIAACGVSPIVRVPDNQGWMVKRECLLSG